MTSAKCMNCDTPLAARELSEGWCDSCGKKVPAYLLDQRPKAERKGQVKNAASGVLFAIAILEILGAIALFALAASRHVPYDTRWALGAVVVATVFIALGMWADSRPKSAAAVGLVLYLPLALISVAVAPTPLGIAIKTVLVICLFKAIANSSEG